jgi:inhibitor of cysteine peptidase
VRGIPRLTLVLLLALAAVVLVGCGDSDGSGSSGSGDGSAEVFGTGDDITVAQGERFVIALTSNPSTGYSWSAESNPNARFLRSEQVPGPNRPGAPGTQRLTFLATTPGSSTLVLEYVRPWEFGVPPARTESFPLTVTK